MEQSSRAPGTFPIRERVNYLGNRLPDRLFVSLDLQVWSKRWLVGIINTRKMLKVAIACATVQTLGIARFALSERCVDKYFEIIRQLRANLGSNCSVWGN